MYYVNDQIIIDARQIDKTFKIKSAFVPVLKQVNLKVHKGEFIVVTGPSGCGKSTLLHIILGLEAPTSGQVNFLGQDLYANTTEDDRTQVRKKRVGMIYQQPNWIKSFTVLENVMFVLRINGKTDRYAREKALKALTDVGMGQWHDYKPMELSSGQQQKVALARAVLTDPEIIIADEPTGNLDFKSGQEFMQLLKNLSNAGRTIIMVTHDLEYLSYATRAVLMLDGKIVGEVYGDDLATKIEGFKRLMTTLNRV